MFCFLLSQYFHIAIDYFHKVHIGNKNRQCCIFSNLKRLQVKRHLQFMTEDNLAVKKTSIWRLAEKKKGSWIQSRLKLSIKKPNVFRLAASELVAAAIFFFLSSYALSFKFPMLKSTAQEKEKWRQKRLATALITRWNIYIFVCVYVRYY